MPAPVKSTSSRTAPPASLLFIFLPLRRGARPNPRARPTAWSVADAGTATVPVLYDGILSGGDARGPARADDAMHTLVFRAVVGRA